VRRLVAGNWKMHGTAAEGTRLARAVVRELADVLGRPDAPQVVLCPPFTALHAVGQALAGSGVLLGAQNVHWAASGAFTGEVSAPMLAEAGCTFVVVGHSERRQHFGESDEHVARRLRAALDHGLVPILCVGERWEERAAGAAESRIAGQVRSALEGLGAEDRSRVVVAYEPVWAIGTGRAATAEDAARAAEVIRAAAGEDVRVLYGGSVSPENAGGFFRARGVDGALVGGASLDATAFAAIVRA
jgi:triosephosphate isomerase